MKHGIRGHLPLWQKIKLEWEKSTQVRKHEINHYNTLQLCQKTFHSFSKN